MGVSPFQLTQHDGRLYARGVSDDKGHIICRLAALDAVRAIIGQLPCRIKMLIEGEEEISSVSLPSFIAAHKDKLAAERACGSRVVSMRAERLCKRRASAASAT